MRGFPPIQIFILGLLFGLLAVPLANLTGLGRQAGQAHEDHDGHDHDPKVVKGGTEHPEGEHKHVEVPALIRLRYAHKPLSISLKSGGRELLAKLDLAASPAELQTEVEVSHEGNEFSLEARWPEGTPDTALTVEIEPDGFDARRETCWSNGPELAEILTLTW